MRKTVSSSASRRVAKSTAKDLEHEEDRKGFNLSLNRANYYKLQELLGRRHVSHAIDLVIEHLIEELEKGET